MISVNFDADRVLAEAWGYLGLFGAKQRVVAQRAVNRTARGVRTDTAREARRVVKIPAKFIRDSIKIKRAAFKSVRAEVDFLWRRMPLYAFAPRPRKPVQDGGRRPKIGPSVAVSLAGGRKTVAGAFVQRVGGHVGIFRRTGDARFPIRELFGPDLTAYLRPDRPLMRRLEALASARLSRELEHQIDYALLHEGKK